MLILIIILLILVSVLLVTVVLIQDSKGGLTSQSSATQLMGVKRTGDLMERLTWGFAGGIMLLCVLSSFVLKSEGNEAAPSVNIEKAGRTPSAAPQQQPQQQAPASNTDSVVQNQK
jgi:preprotein translocase subunit SecG